MDALLGNWDGFCGGCFVRLNCQSASSLCEENTLLDFGCRAP
jgi:hypothetical protein